jgi:hypothetical protein
MTGTVLGERGLIASFGDAYRNYHRNVPMLIPFLTDDFLGNKINNNLKFKEETRRIRMKKFERWFATVYGKAVGSPSTGCGCNTQNENCSIAGMAGKCWCRTLW